MRFQFLLASAIGIAVLGFVSPAGAQAMKSKVSFNNNIGKETGAQPAGGKTVSLYVAACWAGNDISPSSKESGEPHTFLRSENLCGR